MSLQDRRRRIYHKAKSAPTHRFWGLVVHGTNFHTLHEAYRGAKHNGGAAGIDGQTFAASEQAGRWRFLADLRQELLSGRYPPQANRRVDSPKGHGTSRTLQIPCIRERVVQGALKLMLAAIFAADCCENAYGYRPRRTPQQALAEVRRSVLRRRSMGIAVDLSSYFDTIGHAGLLGKIATRVQDPQVLPLSKQIIQVGGHIGVPQGGPLSPLAANSYLHEVDGAFDASRCKTAEGTYEAVHSHRFAADIVITVSGHRSKRGWAQRAVQRLQEVLAPLGVRLNPEQTKMGDTLTGGACSFLGFDVRRVSRRRGEGHFILITPKKSARLAIKAQIREVIRQAGATPLKEVIARSNRVLAGWVHYFRCGHASRAFSEVRDYVEMKIRTRLTRRKRRRKRSIGWRRWSNEYLYDVLGLCWDWNVRYLPNAGRHT